MMARPRASMKPMPSAGWCAIRGPSVPIPEAPGKVRLHPGADGGDDEEHGVGAQQQTTKVCGHVLFSDVTCHKAACVRSNARGEPRLEAGAADAVGASAPHCSVH